MRQLAIKMEKISLLGVLWSLIINVCKAFWYPEDEGRCAINTKTVILQFLLQLIWLERAKSELAILALLKKDSKGFIVISIKSTLFEGETRTFGGLDAVI